MKTLTNVSEIYEAGGSTPLARSNPAVTEVSEPRITKYVRPDCGICGCCGCACNPCAALLSALCLCRLCAPRCGCGCPRCGNSCGCGFVVTAFDGRGCGCRGYSRYYPYY